MMAWRDPATSGPEARERQRRTFERTAELYERYRPTYPAPLFEDVGDYAALNPDERILEIGCGTGQATATLARWGHALLALDPAPAMAEITRRRLARSVNVQIKVATFEDWTLEPEAFALVVCAQAFHWLDPATRYERIAATLRPRGTVALMRNTQVTPAHNRIFFERVQDVYLRYAPELAHHGAFCTEPSDQGLEELASTGLFDDVQVRRHPWHWTLERDDYLGLLSTHSPHAAMDADARRRLLAGIGELIDAEFRGCVTEHYVAEAYLGRKS